MPKSKANEENIDDNCDKTKNLEVSLFSRRIIPEILFPFLDPIFVKLSFAFGKLSLVFESLSTSATTLIAPTVSDINIVISEKKPCSSV